MVSESSFPAAGHAHKISVHHHKARTRRSGEDSTVVISESEQGIRCLRKFDLH